MVVSIVKEEHDSLRTVMEQQLTVRLNELGNPTVTYEQEFGHNRLKGLGEKNTYLELCDKGIDAILTVSLIDLSKKAYQKKNSINEKYPAAFYYDRIWNYRKLQEDTAGQEPLNDRRYVWEAILFDLGSLQPQYVWQTTEFSPGDIIKESIELPQWIIHRMLKEKIIKKQPPVPAAHKPF